MIVHIVFRRDNKSWPSASFKKSSVKTITNNQSLYQVMSYVKN